MSMKTHEGGEHHETAADHHESAAHIIGSGQAL